MLSEPVALTSGSARVTVLPDEGGVALDLVVAGRAVLARTPWADTVVASADPAPDEDAWVRRWRGGWQLCFPAAGQPDPRDRPRQGFHGAASQAPWTVVDRSRESVLLSWQDAAGLRADRRWVLSDGGLEVSTTVANSGMPRTFAVAEHLILGGAMTEAIAREGGRIAAPSATLIADLDYDGIPTARTTRWPGDWEGVDEATPARVAALLDPRPRRVTVAAGDLVATVTWTGLDHALVWEELGRSTDPPWNGAVHALGVEPTSTPHGAGSGWGGPLLALEPGASLTWTTALRISRAPGKEDS